MDATPHCVKDVTCGIEAQTCITHTVSNMYYYNVSGGLDGNVKDYYDREDSPIDARRDESN